MLRAVSGICVETQALIVSSGARRDIFNVFRSSTFFSTASGSQTVLAASKVGANPIAAPPAPDRKPPERTPSPKRQSSRRVWFATAGIVTAAIGGTYLYKKFNENKLDIAIDVVKKKTADKDKAKPYPALAEQLPEKVDFLLIGGGTASFAALRAIRAARPDASVLVVSLENSLPYMRPPLSKELWKEPNLAESVANWDNLTFSQWNGKRRSVFFEPSAFYTPIEELPTKSGASVALGWKVERLHVTDHLAEVTAGNQRTSIEYGKCLIATGVVPKRIAALKGAGNKSLTIRNINDVASLASILKDSPKRIAVVGGGFLASELTASIAHANKDKHSVIQIFREDAAMSQVLPQYLAHEASNKITETGALIMANTEVVSSRLKDDRVQLQLSSGTSLEVDAVVECVGSEPAVDLAVSSQIELDPLLGGIVVNAELQARADVFAAGDAASFHDVRLGRRRVEHHDHAVLSGRRAGANMAAPAPRAYTHQSMFWSDLGPDLGYEAIGIIDSKLPTVGVFSEEAVSESKVHAVEDNVNQQNAPAHHVSKSSPPKRYDNGVVFYLRDNRVVGVLLWNLFNRIHIARQVMAQGEFEDLLEVAKLFTPQAQAQDEN